MKPLIAQSGLEYHVNLSFTIELSNSQHQWFQILFERIIKYTSHINDEGVEIQFNVDVNEEISNFGGFRDVPGKTEVNKFMPILLSSDTLLNSEIIFLSKVIKFYITKEEFNKRKVPMDVIILDNKISKALEEPQIIIKNLVLSKNKQKP